MNPTDAADHAVSLLPNLEPILAIAIALNLAYIGLPRFRYRDRISNKIKEVMKANDIAEKDPALEKNKWHGAVIRLANISDNFVGFLNNFKLFFKKTPKNDFEGVWYIIYEWVYMCNLDRFVAIFLATINIATIILGVCHTIDRDFVLYDYFSSPNIIWLVKYVVISMIAPAMCVVGGNYVASSAINRATSEITNIANIRQKEIADLATPEMAHQSREPSSSNGAPMER